MIDLSWHYAPGGYVNRHGLAPEWVGTRLFYVPPQVDLHSLEMLRIDAQRQFEACWPMCAFPRVCAYATRCEREQERALGVQRARSALAG